MTPQKPRIVAGGNVRVSHGLTKQCKPASLVVNDLRLTLGIKSVPTVKVPLPSSTDNETEGSLIAISLNAIAEDNNLKSISPEFMFDVIVENLRTMVELEAKGDRLKKMHTLSSIIKTGELKDQDIRPDSPWKRVKLNKGRMNTIGGIASLIHSPLAGMQRKIEPFHIKLNKNFSGALDANNIQKSVTMMNQSNSDESIKLHPEKDSEDAPKILLPAPSKEDEIDPMSQSLMLQENTESPPQGDSPAQSARKNLTDQDIIATSPKEPLQPAVGSKNIESPTLTSEDKSARIRKSVQLEGYLNPTNNPALSLTLGIDNIEPGSEIASKAAEVMMMRALSNSPRLTNKRNSVVQIIKPNIDHKIRLLKKYSKWMVLMQLPVVEPKLLKYCSFGYNALLVRSKIKRAALQIGGINNSPDSRESLYGNIDNLRPIPEEWKTSPFKPPGEVPLPDRRTLDKVSIYHYFHFLSLDINLLYRRLPERLADTLRQNMKVCILETGVIVPYHFFTPRDILAGSYSCPMYKEREDSENRLVVVFQDSMSCMTKVVEGLFLCQMRDDDVLMDSMWIVLNYPGQPFTVYSSEEPLTNTGIAHIYDRMIVKVLKDSLIEASSLKICFLSFGYGSMIASTLMTQMGSNCSSLQLFLSFNGLFYNDSKVQKSTADLKNILLKSHPTVHKRLIQVIDGSEISLKQIVDQPSRSLSKSITQDFDANSRIYVLSHVENSVPLQCTLSLIDAPVICCYSDTNIWCRPDQSKRFVKAISSKEKYLIPLEINHHSLELNPEKVFYLLSKCIVHSIEPTQLSSILRK